MKAFLALGLLAALLPAWALADAPQMYKWTDAQGVIHFSDQPPAQSVPDVQTLDVPQFPPVDQAKLAAEQAALTTQLTALQKLLDAQAAQQAREREAVLAAQKAQLETELTALRQQQAEENERVPLIYAVSPFIPRAFRSNLYVFHHEPVRQPPATMHSPGPVRFKP